MAKKPLTPEQLAKFSKTGKSNVRSSKEHERRVANLLTEWAGVQFRRRRVEGKDVGTLALELVGDIIPIHGQYRFSVECKKGKGFSLDALFANPAACLFTEWWHQACYDAQLLRADLKRNVHPMMFFKPHPNWDWVALSAHALEFLMPHSDLYTGDCRLPESATSDSYRAFAEFHKDQTQTCFNQYRLWFPYILFSQYEWMGPVEGDVSHSKKNPKMVSVKLDPVVICRWRDFATNVCPKSAFLVYPNQEEPPPPPAQT